MKEKNQEIKFKIYSTEEYDRIVDNLLKIPITWNPKKISNLISKKFSLTIIPTQPLTKEGIESFPFYRIRVWNEGQEPVKEDDPDAFSYPPKKHMKYGRANRKGMQVLYGAGDSHTPFHEKKQEIIPSKSIIYLTKWGIKEYPGTLLMRSLFLGIPVEKDSYAAIMARALNLGMKKYFTKWPKDAEKFFLYGQKKYNDLFCVESDLYYHITSSMVYDSFVLSAKQGISIPIIAYPSVAKNKSSVNFIIRKDFVDKYMYIKEVQKIVVNEIADDKIEATVSAKGILIDGKIQWKKIQAKLNEIEYCSAKVIFNNNKKTIRDLLPSEKITICCKDHGMTVKDFLDRNNINESEIMKQLISTNISPNENQLPIKVQSTIVAPTYGNVYLTDNISDNSKISHIIIPFSYIVDYQKNN